MKNRSGFVSNSSTSSFVILGWIMTDEDERAMTPEQHEEWSEAGLYHYNEPQCIFGEVLAEARDGEEPLTNGEHSLPGLMEKANKLAAKFGRHVEKIKLLTGTRLS